LQKIEMLLMLIGVSIQQSISAKALTNNMSSSNVTQFDLSTFAPSAPSICIPRVFSNITRARVEAIFRNLDFGEIEKVDMVQKTNAKGQKYQRVFVHFKEWNDDEQTQQARQMLLSDQEVKVVYDDPWFWKLSASKSVRPEDRPKRKKRPAPFVDFTATSAPSTPREPGEIAEKRTAPGAPKKSRKRVDYSAVAKTD